MRSGLFEETLKQHKDSLTDELVQLGKNRQAQLAEWDIEQNESDYEFYFNAGWNAQQSKIENLRKCIDNSKDIVEGIVARSIGNQEIQKLCGDLIDVLDDIEGGE